MEQLFKAIVKASTEIDGVEKGATVGKGYNSYKGVTDKDVKLKVGGIMKANGLAILPIDIEPKVTINRWIDQDKAKQSVFTEVKTKYLIIHTSGQSIEVAGYGQGIDAQDKGAGKATTYALKNALLYAFMVPTGEIDDTDTTHSNDIDTPPGDITELALRGAKTLDQLRREFEALTPEQKQEYEVIKNDCKNKLTK